jgi:hypothetical protein
MNDSIAAIKALELHSALPQTLEERSRRLSLACRGALSIALSRRQAGLPDPTPAPWPASTWEFLARHARQARQSAG